MFQYVSVCFFCGSYRSVNNIRICISCMTASQLHMHRQGSWRTLCVRLGLPVKVFGETARDLKPYEEAMQIEENKTHTNKKHIEHLQLSWDAELIEIGCISSFCPSAADRTCIMSDIARVHWLTYILTLFSISATCWHVVVACVHLPDCHCL